MEIPKVILPEKGLTDVFVSVMAKAMDTTPEEIKVILKL